MDKRHRYEEFDDDFENGGNNEKEIDWEGIFRKLYSRRKLFIWSFIITAVVASPLLLTIPKFYLVEVKLAPEFTSSSSSSTSLAGLSSLMRSLGIGGSTTSSSDAIRPSLYPDLINSTAFKVSLFDIQVKSGDGLLETTYYDYLAKHQKSPIWSKVIKLIKNLFSKKPSDTEGSITANAGHLTESQAKIVDKISEKVVCSIDLETGVITIDVKDQDPVICAAIADSTCQRLQEFITEYRTKKARVEMENAYRQYVQANEEYEEAKQRVESFNDSNWDLVDEDMIVRKQALANDMQFKFSNMSAFNQQYLGARSKYESLRPVFTVLDGASVPLMPSGPGRKKILFTLLALVLGSEAAWVLLKDSLKKVVAKVKDYETVNL